MIIFGLSPPAHVCSMRESRGRGSSPCAWVRRLSSVRVDVATPLCGWPDRVFACYLPQDETSVFVRIGYASPVPVEDAEFVAVRALSQRSGGISAFLRWMALYEGSKRPVA